VLATILFGRQSPFSHTHSHFTFYVDAAYDNEISVAEREELCSIQLYYEDNEYEERKKEPEGASKKK
jgi:hypothetical protein